MSRALCPFHSDETVVGTFLSAEEGEEFTCLIASGHPAGQPWVWVTPPPPPPKIAKVEESLTKQLDLSKKLPDAVQQATNGITWAEYGIVEHQFAVANPEDFALLVDRLGHRAVKRQEYTVSKYLARRLADLSRQGLIAYHPGPATGRWAYDNGVSWWAIPPAPEWGSAQRSWEAAALTISYVPGRTELA